MILEELRNIVFVDDAYHILRTVGSPVHGYCNAVNSSASSDFACSTHCFIIGHHSPAVFLEASGCCCKALRSIVSKSLVRRKVLRTIHPYFCTSLKYFAMFNDRFSEVRVYFFLQSDSLIQSVLR